jgi:hypothetical protein
MARRTEAPREVSVEVEIGSVAFVAHVEMIGRHRAASRWEPGDSPEASIVKVWRTEYDAEDNESTAEIGANALTAKEREAIEEAASEQDYLDRERAEERYDYPDHHY